MPSITFGQSSSDGGGGGGGGGGTAVAVVVVLVLVCALGLYCYCRPRGGKEGTPEVRGLAPPPPPAAGGNAGLPDGWIQVVDGTSGRPYYVHVATSNTTWVKPGSGPGRV